MIDKHQEEFREKVRAFALEQVEPAAARLDREQKFLEEHLKPAIRQAVNRYNLQEEHEGAPAESGRGSGG